MALTIQNIIDDVSYELKTRLDGTSGSGDDFNLMQRWVDQVHKDVLHTSLFRHMLRRSTTVSTTAGTYSYNLTPTNLRRVFAVHDRRAKAFLSPIDELLDPSVTQDVQKVEGASRPSKYLSETRASTAYPQYYWLQSTVSSGTPAHVLFVFPAPFASEHTGTIDVLYERLVPTITGGSTNLEVGDDGRDIMVAGTLARAFKYAHKYDLARMWQEIYESMKRGELR